MAQAHITWEEQVGVLSYTVQYKPYNAVNWNTFSSVPAGTTSETVTGLNENALYHFRILSVCEDVTCDIIQPIVLFDVSFSCPEITLTSDADSISYSFPKQGDEIDKYMLRLYSGDGQTLLETRLIIPNAANPIEGTFSATLDEGVNYLVQLTMYADWAGVNPHVCGMIGKSTTSPPAHLYWTFVDNSSSPEGRFILKFNGVTQVDTLVNGSNDYPMESGTLVEVIVQGYPEDQKLLDVASLSASIDEEFDQLTTITYSFTVVGGETYNVDAIINEVLYNACNDFGLALSDVAGQSISLLKAGVVTSTTGVVGAYVIDWYLNNTAGQPAFSSGSNGVVDPTVTVYHPFNNEPVEGGTWFPVIKYIFIDGIKYTRIKTAGARYSPSLLTCLVSINIQNFNCANANALGNLAVHNSGGYYGHKISYNNTINSATLASRSFRFDLDAINKYFAWAFAAYSVSDTMKITYVSPTNGTSQQVAHWVNGADGGTQNVTTDPARYSSSNVMKVVTPLTQFTFAAGDYLLIQIFPSATQSNTNWDFGCRCLDTIDCNIFDKTLRQIVQGSVNLYWNPNDCAWVLNYTKPAWSDNINNSWLYKLHSWIEFSTGGHTGGSYVNNFTNILLYHRTSAFHSSVAGYASCAALNGTSTITKVSATEATLSFTSQADYDLYKTGYQEALSHAIISNYTTDPTKANHYKYWVLRLEIGSSCGDNKTVHTLWSHLSVHPSFNDATRTVTYYKTVITNQYVPSNSCDLTGTAINSGISSINQSFWSLPNGTVYNTSIRGSTRPLTGISTTQSVTADMQITRSRYIVGIKIESCDLLPKGWSNQRLPQYQWDFVFFNDRVTILDINDPPNNFRLERAVNYDSGVNIALAANYIKVYEKINGVVTVDTGHP